MTASMNTDQLAARANELRTQLTARPEDARVSAELAYVIAQLGDYASALDHDARAWASCPNDPTPILHMIGILVDSGKWLGAMVAFEIVREGVPPDTAFALDLAATQVFRQIGGMFPPRGSRPEADVLIDRLVASCRTRPDALQLAVARTLIDIGRLSDGAALIARLGSETAEAGSLAHVCFLRGVLCERAADDMGAVSNYEQSLALAVRPDAAINLISILLEVPGAEATTRLGEVLALLGADMRDLPLVRYYEAMYLRRAGHQDSAVALLSRIAIERDTELGRMARQVLASC